MYNNKVDCGVWYEKYKPTCLEDVALPNELRARLTQALKESNLPNLGLWSNAPGLGKSSLANALMHAYDGDALWLNTSMHRGIDVVRNRVSRFVKTPSVDGRPKLVILDECDNLTPDAQAAFRGFIDEYSTCARFIFTGNYRHKVIQPLQDRLENYDFADFSREEMIPQVIKRASFILEQEGKTYDMEDVETLVNECFPSVRTVVGALQRMTSTGHFVLNLEQLKDDQEKVFDLLMSRNFNSLYEYVNSLNSFDTMYSYLFDFLDTRFIERGRISIALAHYAELDTKVRDKRLPLMALLSEIAAYCVPADYYEKKAAKEAQANNSWMVSYDNLKS